MSGTRELSKCEITKIQQSLPHVGGWSRYCDVENTGDDGVYARCEIHSVYDRTPGAEAKRDLAFIKSAPGMIRRLLREIKRLKATP